MCLDLRCCSALVVPGLQLSSVCLDIRIVLALIELFVLLWCVPKNCLSNSFMMSPITVTPRTHRPPPRNAGTRAGPQQEAVPAGTGCCALAATHQ